jgi:hypothetical protein
MNLWRFGVAVALATLAVTPIGAQQPAVTLDDDDITIRGCIGPVSGHSAIAPTMLVWSRGDIMLAGVTAVGSDAPNPVGTSGVAGRMFYWLEDDEDLSKHVGQLVEIKGELEDFEKGTVEIERHGEFTEIELDLGGKEEKARIPTSWLGPPISSKDREFDIVARRIDVDEVRVLGACNPRLNILERLPTPLRQYGVGIVGDARSGTTPGLDASTTSPGTRSSTGSVPAECQLLATQQGIDHYGR